MKNVKLTIEYDGTDFNGWQIQASGRTVQGEIEKAVATMTRQHVRVTGSGRTDAGVHALGQVAAFRCDTRIAPEAFFSGLNSLLPEDIVIRSCEAADTSFHPRFDATAKTYVYRIRNRPLPCAIGRKYCWHVRNPLDIAAMQDALSHITGTRDFRAFENTGSPRSHTVRTVFRATVHADPGGENPAFPPAASAAAATGAPPAAPPGSGGLAFRITADGFLRCMVRNLVAAIVDVGLLRLAPEDIAVILEKKNRALAPATAPPQGLFLESVSYDGAAGGPA